MPNLNLAVIKAVDEACEKGGEITEIIVSGNQLILFFESEEYPVKIIHVKEAL